MRKLNTCITGLVGIHMADFLIKKISDFLLSSNESLKFE